MEEKGQKKISVERLVSLFLKLRPRRPEPDQADYSRWNQSEEAYRQEQDEWLAEVERKKKNKK